MHPAFLLAPLPRSRAAPRQATSRATAACTAAGRNLPSGIGGNGNGSGSGSGGPPIAVDKLCFSWSASEPVLHNLTFSVQPGELCMLVGPNGSGKTTLLRLLRGLLLPDAGAASVARPCAYVQQDAGAQIAMPTVGHDIALSVPAGRELPREEVVAVVRGALEDVGLVPTDRFVSAAPSRLSGVQRQRAVLAAALVRRPKVMLFDEPTANMDPLAKAEVMELSRRLVTERQLAALWVTHLLDELDFADRILIMEGGRLIAQGPRVAMMPLIYDLYDPD